MRVLKGTLISLTTVLLVLVLVEIGARATTSPVSRVNWTPIPQNLRIDATIPGVPWMLRPGGSGVHEFGTDPRGYFDPGASLTYRINSLGFRGPETTRAKPEGVYRILGFGDSFTFGEGVRAEHTFLAGLQERLDAGRSGVFEVLNLGVSGYDTVGEYSLLNSVGVDLAPDLVVFCFFLNDASGTATIEPFNAGTEEDELPWWRRHSRLLDKLAAGMERREAVEDLVADYRESFAEDSRGWRRAQEAFTRTLALAEEHDFRFALVIFPVLWRLSDDYPFRGIHEKVAAAAGSRGIPVLDLLPHFAGHDGPELWVHPNNQHPNEVAHALVAEALHEFLNEANLLDSRR